MLSKEEIKAMLKPNRRTYEIAIYSSENYFNTGAVIRTGHAFMCKKFWLIDFNKFYKKASMGTHKYEDIEKISLSDFFHINRDRNIVSFERRQGLEGENIFDFEYPDNPIFFFGSEKFGVPQEVLNRSTVVTIPLEGIHNDLNIATAAGIVMYDFIGKTR